MLEHVHFEVAVPDTKSPIDAGGFLLDNEGGKRERNPRFCRVSGETASKIRATAPRLVEVAYSNLRRRRDQRLGESAGVRVAAGIAR
jgi:hypothetical protein